MASDEAAERVANFDFGLVQPERPVVQPDCRLAGYDPRMAMALRVQGPEELVVTASAATTELSQMRRKRRKEGALVRRARSWACPADSSAAISVVCAIIVSPGRRESGPL